MTTANLPIPTLLKTLTLNNMVSTTDNVPLHSDSVINVAASNIQIDLKDFLMLVATYSNATYEQLTTRTDLKILMFDLVCLEQKGLAEVVSEVNAFLVLN